MSDPFPPIRLTKLELQNFRCFRQIEIEFNRRLTVIVAPNGGGKTAILDAVAASWRLFVDTMLTKASSVGFDHSDIRLELSQLKTMEPRLPTSLTADGFLAPEKDEMTNFQSETRWIRQLGSDQPHAKTSYVDASLLKQFADSLRAQFQNEEKKSPDSSPTFPVIAYYGTGRLFGSHKLTKNKKEQPQTHTSRYKGYEDCLTASSRYKFFVDWFERFSREAQDEIASGKPSQHQPQLKLQAVKDAVNSVLKPSGWHSLKWDFAQGVIAAQHPQHGNLPVDALSDGVRNMIGLVADIAHRAVRLNPQFGADAAKLTPGVILIDEVDMHLHPEWQQLVLQALLDAFPLIQFIVTTHSPQVLTTVTKDNIRILACDDAGYWTASPPHHSPFARESGDALADVMYVDPIPKQSDSQKAFLEVLGDYEQLVRSGQKDLPTAVELRTKIDVAGYEIPDATMALWDFLATKRNEAAAP